MNKYKIWIPVSERLPKVGFRVWASEGGNDCGNDCYYGYKPARMFSNNFGNIEWRYSHNSEPVRRPILFWMELPHGPERKETYLWDPKKIAIDVEHVQQVIREKNEINSIPFENIVWYQDGKELSITQQVLDNWKYLGLSNIYFVDEKFWMSYEELDNVPN